MEALKKEFDEKLEKILKAFEAMLAAQNQNRKQSDLHPTTGNGSSSILVHTNSIIGAYDHGNQVSGNCEGIFCTINFEFPKYHGSNPRSWIRKCNKLFSHHAVAKDQKLYLATLHLKGEAENWYSSFVESGIELAWTGLIDEILARFSTEIKVIDC